MPQNGQIYNPHAAEPPAAPAVERDPETGRFQKTGLSAGLIQQAKAAGLTDDDLRDMDPADVRDHVRESRFESRLEKFFRLQEASRPNPTGPPGPVEPKAVDIGLDEGSYDAGLVAALRKLTERVAKLEAENADLPQFKEHVASQARQQNESFGRAIEKAFARHPEIFGTGPIDKLDKDSEEYDFRMAAVKAHRKAGAALDELQKNIDEFVEKRFSRKNAEPDDQLSEVEKWERGQSDNGVLGRPTQRGRVEAPPGKEKAVEAANARLPRTGTQREGRGAYLNHNRPG